MVEKHIHLHIFGRKMEIRRIDLIGILLEKYPYLADEKIVDILTDNGWFLHHQESYIFSYKIQSNEISNSLECTGK